MLGLPVVELSEVDRLLMLARTRYDLDKCPCGCGGFADETLAVDGWHEADTVVCDRRRAMDELRADQQGDPPPGELIYAYLADDVG